MADAATGHKFRDSDISLREYVDTRVNATVQSREAAVTDMRLLLEEKLKGLCDLLQADMATLRATIDERDKLYNERSTTGKTAVDAALKSAETAVNSAFAASEKAIVKSDVNAEKWRENANEWRAAMMDRESKFAPRAEMETELKSLRNEIAGLKKVQDLTAGGQAHTVDLRAWLTAGVGVVVLMLALATFIIARVDTKEPAPQVIYTPAPAGTQLPTSPPAAVPR